MVKNSLIAFFSLLLISAAIRAESRQFEVIDSSYTVCTTEQQYRQLLSYSLYGVGKPPATGCFAAPGGAKAIILQCPESDIILCQFRLEPDATEAIHVWASKVMLRERQ
ncbi:hypothetical protein [Amphritea sp. HPY]|uniref:hypothetical protein n=1 Tax=Amphritea sp. HPY TaxID=3421652 RepID=UPI003D7E89E3